MPVYYLGEARAPNQMTDVFNIPTRHDPVHQDTFSTWLPPPGPGLPGPRLAPSVRASLKLPEQARALTRRSGTPLV